MRSWWPPWLDRPQRCLKLICVSVWAALHGTYRRDVFFGSKARRAAVCRSACQETGVWVSSAGSTPGGACQESWETSAWAHCRDWCNYAWWPSCSMLQSLKNLATKIGRPHKRHHVDLCSDFCLLPYIFCWWQVSQGVSKMDYFILIVKVLYIADKFICTIIWKSWRQIISTNQAVNHQFVSHSWSCPYGRPICTTHAPQLARHPQTSWFYMRPRLLYSKEEDPWLVLEDRVSRSIRVLGAYEVTVGLRKFHVRFGGCDFGRNCFALCDEFCAILWVMDTWSATCTASFQSVWTRLLVLSFCSQSIRKSTSCHR